MPTEHFDPRNLESLLEDTTEVVPVDRARPPERRRDRCTLTLLGGPEAGVVYAVDRDEVVVGRGTEADLRIDDRALSRRHVRIFRLGQELFIEDLCSTNGTWVDEVAVCGLHRLEDGARIHLGHSTVVRCDLHDEGEQEAVMQIYESAVRDPLTGLYNRRYLDDRLHAEVAFAARHGTVLSIVLLDLDHFKRVNDSFGHPAGDAVLRVVGGSLARMVRAEDVVARYGGEEFIIVARGVDREGGRVLAERVRRALGSIAIPWEGRSVQVTVSVGVASMGAGYATVDDLVRAGDAALYRAKGGGRNRVEA